MKILIYTSILFILQQRTEGAKCGSSRIICKDKYSYNFCANVGDYDLIMNFATMNCPKDRVCSELTYFPCVLENEAPTTTTPQILTEPPSSTQKTTFTSTAATLPLITKQSPTFTTFKPTPLSTILTTISELIPTTKVTQKDVVPTLSSLITLSETQATTPAPCPNPNGASKPNCNKLGDTFPGPTCVTYYKCIPIWFGYGPEKHTCGEGKAYSASQKKCISPPNGCTCAN